MTGPSPEPDGVLDLAVTHAKAYLEGLSQRRVPPELSTDQIADVLGGPLPEMGRDPQQVIEQLCEKAGSA